MFHQRSIARLLIAETLKIEALLNQHAIELRPRDDSLVVIISLVEKPKQALINLFLAVLQVPLPRLEMLYALGKELLERELVGVLLEGVLEEAQDVLVDIDGQVGRQPLHLDV